MSMQGKIMLSVLFNIPDEVLIDSDGVNDGSKFLQLIERIIGIEKDTEDAAEFHALLEGGINDANDQFFNGRKIITDVRLEVERADSIG